MVYTHDSSRFMELLTGYHLVTVCTFLSLYFVIYIYISPPLNFSTCVLFVQFIVFSVDYPMYSVAVCPPKLGRTTPSISRLKRDGTRAETRFGLSAQQTSPFKLARGVCSVDYWQPKCAHQR